MISCKKEKISIHSLIKDINKEAKKIRKQRISENKAKLKEEKEERLLHAVELGPVDYSVESKSFSLSVDGKEEVFASRSELRKSLRRKYRGIGKEKNSKACFSFLPIIIIGFLVIGIGAFFLAIEEGLSMALAAMLASVIIALLLYVILVLLRWCVSGKFTLIPRYREYVETERKPSKAGITATFFLFTIITTIITELTKKAISAICEKGLAINVNKVLGGIFVGAGVLIFILAFFENEILNAFAWLSSFVKFSKIETEEKPADNETSNN